jgi:hypothetical protein
MRGICAAPGTPTPPANAAACRLSGPETGACNKLLNSGEIKIVSRRGWFLIHWLMATTKKTATKSEPKKTNAAFLKPVTPDDKLAAVVGAHPLPRTELTSKLWAYIKQHKLQDPKKRTMINADDKLKAVFDGKAQVTMFEMNKLVSGHVK